MFKGNYNLVVGLFVSVALAGVAAFAMWFAGARGGEALERYSILFERDVSGLSLGGPVYFMGVQVGRVVEMDILATADHVQVRVDIEIAADTPVDGGTYASLVPQGITGVNVINIATEPGVTGGLPRPEGFDHPLIPVRQTGLSALLAQAPDTISKLNALLDQANQLLDEANRGAFARALEHVEALAEALALERETIGTLPVEMQAFVTDSRAMIREVRDLLGELRPDLSDTMGQLNETSASLSQLSRRFDTWLTENEPEFRHFIDNGLGQAPELMSDLRGTMRELQKLLQQLQDDPSQLIHRTPDEYLEVEP